MTPDRPRVLFVDDEPNLLAGVRRALHRWTAHWDMVFVTSGAQALEVLAAQSFDVIVSDMRMPGINGGQLLSQVQRDYPGTARIVLSGDAERHAVLAAAASAHQFLAKPCDNTQLVAVITRVLDVRRSMADPVLVDLIGGAAGLPTLPTVYYEFTRMMAKPDVSVDAVARVLASDVGTSAEVLRLTNSAFFGLPRRVHSVQQAVRMLGLDNIQALVAAGATFRPDGCPPSVDGRTLQQVALQRSAMVRRAAGCLNWDADQVTPVALASMLRDVGVLVLASGCPDAARRLSALTGADPTVLDDPRHVAELERAEYGCTVPQASAYLLGLWGFSHQVVSLVAGQPTPLDSPGASPSELLLTVVHQRALRPDVPFPAGPPGSIGALSAHMRSCVADACDTELGRHRAASPLEPDEPAEAAATP